MREVPSAIAARIPRPASRAGRCGAVLLLIAAAVLGVSARRHAALSSAPHRLGHGAWATVLVSAGGLLAGAVGLAAVLLVAWRIAGRLRRTRDPDQPEHVVEQPAGGLGARLAALAVVVLIVGAAAGAVLLGARLGGEGRGSPPPARPARPSVPPAVPGIRHGAPASPGLVWLLVAGLLVVTAAAVLLAVDRLRRPAQPAAGGKTAAGRSHAAADRPHPGADPRSAVIAQYLALEQDLARVRIPREPFETPTELLDRAARGGLPISQARRLAQLFAEARYSSRPVTDGQRVQAERSLAAVRRQWARQRPAAPASPPGGEGA